MWKDTSGYYLKQKLCDTDTEVPTTEVADEVLHLKGDLTFINCGGTIVSEPELSRAGVVPIKNLLKVPAVRSALLKHNLSYHPGVKKLSEDFELKDYTYIQDLVKNSTSSKLVVCHGTDYVTTFSTYMDLLSKKYHKRILVIVSQRSLDKPTSDLVALLDLSPMVLKLVPFKNALVLVRVLDGTFQVHSPYEIRKYDTFSKSCFFSESAVRFKETCPSLRRLGTTLIKPVPELSVGLETFFQSPRADLTVGSGLGNTRSRNPTWVYSKCLSGPLNYSIYNKEHLRPKYTSRDVTSWESLLALSKFSRCLL